MQHAHSIQQTVVEYPDLWHQVLAKIDVSHKGYAAMKNMVKFQKESSAYVALEMKTAPWLLYLRGIEFVLRLRRVQHGSIVIKSWETLFWGLCEYQEIQDVVEDIINIMIAFKSRSSTTYDSALHSHSNDQNRAILTDLAENYSGNDTIETTAISILNDMYRPSWNVQVVAPSNTPQIRLAVACMCRNNRTNNTVEASLKLLLTLCQNNLAQVRVVFEIDRRDIVLIVLDIQENFIDDDQIVESCSSLCDIFLVTWTAPTLPVGVVPPRNVVDIILGCMQQYPGSFSRQIIGCKQLSNLAICNGRDREYTPTSMRVVANLIKQIQNERVDIDVTRDSRACNLWTFVDKVMQNADTYEACVHLFSVTFLQDALMSIFSTHFDKAMTFGSERYVACMQIVSTLLQRILRDNPPATDMFVAQDGVSELVKIGHYHTKSHNIRGCYSQLSGGHDGCLDLLLDTLLAQGTKTTTVLLTSNFNNSIRAREFSVGNMKYPGDHITLCGFLIQSLKFVSTSEYRALRHNEYSIHSARTIQKTLDVLSRATNEGNPICSEILHYMAKFLFFIVNFMTKVNRDMENMTDLILRAVVASYDNLLLNVYRAIPPDREHEEYDLCRCRTLEDYIIAATPYRDTNSNFKDSISEIVKKLQEC